MLGEDAYAAYKAYNYGRKAKRVYNMANRLYGGYQAAKRGYELGSKIGKEIGGAYKGYKKITGSKRRRSVPSGPALGRKAIRRKLVRIPRRVIGKRRFYTVGRMGGKFSKRFRKRRINKFLSYGSLVRDEVELLHQGTHVAEVGHSTCAPKHIIRSVGRSLLRCVIQGGLKHENITDWEATPKWTSQNYVMVIRYRTSPDSATVSASPAHTFTVGLTLLQMADELMDQFLALYTTTQDVPVMESLEFGVNGSGSTETFELPLRQSKICLKITSILRVQNITEANATGGSDIHDVRANPLVGRAWYASGNGIYPHAGTGGFTDVIADETKGLLGTATSPQVRVHHKNFYANAKSSAVMLAPGSIKKSVISDYQQCSLNTLMYKLRRYIARKATVAAADPVTRVAFGRSKMFEFEHIVKNPTDGICVIGCEIDLHVSSYLKWYRKRECREINE